MSPFSPTPCNHNKPTVRLPKSYNEYILNAELECFPCDALPAPARDPLTIQLFVHMPYWLLRFLLVGFLICADLFLHYLTFFPLRLVSSSLGAAASFARR